MALQRICIALLFSVFISTVVAAEGQRVILVLDASGSMRGQINGHTKMNIAKQVVGKVLSTWKAEDELGLVVYGHREKGACSDIETVMPPRALDVGAFMSPIKALVPKGKTPMTQAVRQAAEALQYTEQKSTVILISDGIETCDADPCAVARELEAAGIGLTVHTVGFGLDDKAAVAQLKCMADETGGISVLADNAEDLESALKQTVEAKVAEPAPTPSEPVTTTDLTGHVVMAEGVELPKPFQDAVWVFNQAQPDGSEGEYISTEIGTDLKTDMTKSGELLATVKSDHASVVVPFKHLDGTATVLPVNMNAGLVKFKGMMDESTELPADGPVWVFSKADGRYYATSLGAAPTNLFNAGDYTVKLQMGAAEIETAFTVVAGQSAELLVTLGSGVARITATYTPGGEVVPDGTAIELRKPADVSGQQKWIATDYGNNKAFQVPSGDYVAIVKLDMAEAEVPLKVIAGQEVVINVVLNAGFVAAKVPGAKRIDVLSGKAGLDGKRKRLDTVYADELNLAANAGSYHIIAYGEDEVLIGEKDAVVDAGQRTEISIP
jgi:Ca-activated chloride channel homolog